MYILASINGENCANGMSWLVRKQAIEREGGLVAFSGYLAEDFFIGKALWKKYGLESVFCVHGMRVGDFSEMFLKNVHQKLMLCLLRGFVVTCRI